MCSSDLEDAVLHPAGVDVGVAVATERGLMTPVVREVDRRPLGEVVADLRDLAARAHAGRLRPEEFEGGSIAVSNLGGAGVEEFAAIINPPQSAIVAVGAVRDEAVARDGAVAVEPVLRLTVSVDHRPLDGIVAARWLAMLVAVLEDPLVLVAGPGPGPDPGE